MAFADTTLPGKIIVRAEEPVQLQGLLGEAVVEGDHLGWVAGSSHWVRGHGVAASLVQSSVIAGRSGAAGETINLLRRCIVENRFTGMTPGDPLYMSEEADEEGLYEAAISVTSTNSDTIMGYALTATIAELAPGVWSVVA